MRSELYSKRNKVNNNNKNHNILHLNNRLILNKIKFILKKIFQKLWKNTLMRNLYSKNRSQALLKNTSRAEELSKIKIQKASTALNGLIFQTATLTIRSLKWWNSSWKRVKLSRLKLWTPNISTKGALEIVTSYRLWLLSLKITPN